MVVFFEELVLLGAAVCASRAGGNGAHGVFWGWVEVGWGAGGGGWVVEVAETFFGFGEMAVVEGVGVHLHEHDHGVEDQEDLGCPGPTEQKGHGDPECQPQDLIYAHDGCSAFGPGQGAAGGRIAEELL